SHLRSDFSGSLRILMCVVILVLLIACANLVNYLLSRAASRDREVFTRLALGAGRSRIVRQMLTEALMLSLLGGALGLAIASWGTRFLLDFVVTGAAHTAFDPNPDGRVLAFTLVVSIITGVLFGLAPALRVSRISVISGLRSGTRTTGGSARRAGRPSLSSSLVVAQVSLSLALLVTAGLFARSLKTLENQNFGFDRRNVVLAYLEPRIAGYQPPKLLGLYQQIKDRVSNVAGVRSATFSSFPPIGDAGWSGPVSVLEVPQRPDEATFTSINAVAPDYFETISLQVLMGRTISEQDTAQSPKVAVVSQALANKFFPGGGAIGKHMRLGAPGLNGDWDIVGVAADAKYSSPRETPQNMVYLPLKQMSGENLYAGYLEVRTAGDPSSTTQALRGALSEVDSGLPILSLTTLSQQVAHSMVEDELISKLSGFFSVLALALACIGLYGVMTYNVVRRTNEIGVRMALGAKIREVLWMVMKESLVLLFVGLTLGIPLTLAAMRLVRAQLFGVSPADPLTVFISVLVVSVVAILSGYLPARRATRIDPMAALRYE
ncbi:MAG: FtsX-like permease family protein, partial [Blastocatellia bacterium]